MTAWAGSQLPHISACVRVLVTAADSSRTTENSSMANVSYRVNSKQLAGLQFSLQNRKDTVSLSSCFQVHECQHLTFQHTHTHSSQKLKHKLGLASIGCV